MDIALTNGRFYTLNSRHPWADTVLIRDKQFTFVGDGVGMDFADGTEIVDLQGRVVLPGLLDAHTHPATVAASSWHVQLPDTHNLDEILEFVREYGERHPKEEAPYLYFEYYPTTLFGDGSPTKELLDTAISDRPVLLQDAGDHASWTNSAMLEALGVTRDTEDPLPGLARFARDENGELTGHIFEGAHQYFIENLYAAVDWYPPVDPARETLLPVLDFYTRNGVTALFDAYIESSAQIETISELDRAGDLNSYYEGAVRFWSLNDIESAIQTAKTYDSKFGSKRVRVRTLKLFLDGTNELGNSAVLEPLLSDDNAGTLGAIQMEVNDLTQCLLYANQAGLDLHIHLVGDRAFRVACDAVEAAQDSLANCEDGWVTQVTFAHCELVDPADMSRPEKLGIIINWTPHWSGGYFGEEAIRYLGEERWNRMYRFREFAESGATVTFSSDVVSYAELHRASPFFGIQVASTRVDPEVPLDRQRYPGSLRPQESARIPLETLLRGYTIDAARQMRLSESMGSIEEGKCANLVVLDADPFSTEDSTFSSIVPTAVIFEGEVVAGSL